MSPSFRPDRISTPPLLRLAGLHDDFVAVGELHIVDARPPVDIARRHDDRAAQAGVDVDARAFADEIVAEPFDLDVGDHPAAADLRIDDAHAARALLPLLVFKPARADQHNVAGPHEPRVTLGQLQAQDVTVFGQRGDRLAGQHDLALGDGDAEDAARLGRQHGALARLLRDHAAVGAHRGERALGDVEIGLGEVAPASAC